MTQDFRILLVEDEPLILMDLEWAAEERGFGTYGALNVADALALIENEQARIDVAVLDVTLGSRKNGFEVAHALEMRKIPYILHSGDLDRHDESIRSLDAPLIAKPALPEDVISRAFEWSRLAPEAPQSISAYG